MVNIKDVAKLAGVSHGTVSNVIRGKETVSPQRVEKVMNAIKELNYEVNAVARSLKNKKTKIIGVIVGNAKSIFYSTLANYIEEIANKYGYNIILSNSDYCEDKELEHLKVLKTVQVDGIILTPTGKNSKYVNKLLKSGTKVILLDRLIKKVHCDFVKVNNVNGAYLAVKHLIEQGFKKIGIISGYIEITTGKERLDGYLKALKEYGIKKDENLIKFGNFKKDDGYSLTYELINSKTKPDALFVTILDMTLGSLKAINKLNLRIPKDIAIVGFDDHQFSSLLNPPLTTVHQPMRELGFKAAEMLIKKIENSEKSKKSQSVVLDPKLIIRKSTIRNKSN